MGACPSFLDLTMEVQFYYLPDLTLKYYTLSYLEELMSISLLDWGKQFRIYLLSRKPGINTCSLMKRILNYPKTCRIPHDKDIGP